MQRLILYMFMEEKKTSYSLPPREMKGK